MKLLIQIRHLLITTVVFNSVPYNIAQNPGEIKVHSDTMKIKQVTRRPSVNVIYPPLAISALHTKNYNAITGRNNKLKRRERQKAEPLIHIGFSSAAKSFYTLISSIRDINESNKVDTLYNYTIIDSVISQDFALEVINLIRDQSLKFIAYDLSPRIIEKKQPFFLHDSGTTIIYTGDRITSKYNLFENDTIFRVHCNYNIPYFTTHPETYTCENNPETGISSNIFNSISFSEFYLTVECNILNSGDNLNQTHMTDLCGKFSLVRLWIKKDPEAYKKTMGELYFNGYTTLYDGSVLKASQSIINAVNLPEGLNKDKAQSWGIYTELPARTDMLLMLCLADKFHWTLGSDKPYSNEDNLENNGFWAGSTIGSEIRLLEALGFEAEKLGNNFVGISNSKAIELANAAGVGHTVLLLVNSYKLNTVVLNAIDRPSKGFFVKHTIGTHWISYEGPLNKDSHLFWEYGSLNAATEDFWTSVCGGLIVKYIGNKPE